MLLYMSYRQENVFVRVDSEIGYYFLKIIKTILLVFLIVYSLISFQTKKQKMMFFLCSQTLNKRTKNYFVLRIIGGVAVAALLSASTSISPPDPIQRYNNSSLRLA